MTYQAQPEIADFFAQFERAGNDLDTIWLDSAFADQFLNIGPDLAGPVTKEALIAALPMRDGLFASIGARGSRLSSLIETPLDGMHSIVKTHWQVQFPNAVGNASPLELSSTFLLRREPSGWKIVVYLNHQDIVALVRERSAGVGDGG